MVVPTVMLVLRKGSVDIWIFFTIKNFLLHSVSREMLLNINKFNFMEVSAECEKFIKIQCPESFPDC